MQKIQNKQLSQWLEIVSNQLNTLIENDKPITEKDIINMAKKLQDLENVLIGKSKIKGFRSI